MLYIVNPAVMIPRIGSSVPVAIKPIQKFALILSRYENNWL
jgi:hypothetical protein